MFKRCFLVSDVRAQMVQTGENTFNTLVHIQSAAMLVHAIMTTDIFLSTCYPQGQTERERFLGLQRNHPTTEDDMSGLYYEYGITLLGNSFMPGLTSNSINNTFSNTGDEKFGAAISRHIDRYIRSLQARHEEFYDAIEDRICLIVCHPSYRDAVTAHVRDNTILQPVDVQWLEDGSIVIKN